MMLKILKAILLVFPTSRVAASPQPADPTHQVLPKWETLPLVSTLPGNPKGKLTAINGVNIWSAEFGASNPGLPLLLLHGGLGESEYWSKIVESLMVQHRVIVMDTRGHARSTMDDKPLTFDLYASDATELLKSLNIKKAAFIGWSHMAVATIAAMLGPATAPFVDRAFVFGGYHHTSANNASYTTTSIYKTFVSRALAERKAHQPGDMQRFIKAVSTLDSTLPKYTPNDLYRINLKEKVTVAFGAHEEAINLSEIDLLPQLIKGSRKVILKDTSHFAVLQDPAQFIFHLKKFLA